MMISQLCYRSSNHFKLEDTLDLSIVKNKDQIKLTYCSYSEKGQYSLLLKYLGMSVSLTLKQLGNVKDDS